MFFRVVWLSLMQGIPVMRLMRVSSVRFVAVLLLLPAMLPSPISAQPQSPSPDEPQLWFEGKHRLNAHGNEFNGLAKSSDGQRLFVASEKGEILVWNTVAGKLEQTLRQPRPVHLIASLANAQEFVTAGSYHSAPEKAEVRKWNARTGVSVELQGLAKNSFPIALATEPKAGLIALTTLEGAIHVWDAKSNTLLATWTIANVPNSVAILGRDLYVVTNDRRDLMADSALGESAIIKFNADDQKNGPVDYLRIPDRHWSEVDVSPDRSLLSATYQKEGVNTVFIEPASKAEIATLETRNFAWIDSSKLVLFDWDHPVSIAQFQSNGPPITTPLEGSVKDLEVRPIHITGQVANADGSKVWMAYSKAGGLLEFDLPTGKAKPLIQARPGAYAISVETANGESGHVLTGGADGYVRLWQLSDFSLLKEHQLLGPGYFVIDALLLPGAKRAVAGLMRIRKNREEQQLEPVKVLLVDLETGKHKKLTEAHLWRSRPVVIDNQLLVPEGNRITFISLDTGQIAREFRLKDPIAASAVSANRRWLAVVEHTGKLSLLNLNTFELKTSAIQIPDDAGPIAITNDARYIYVLNAGAQLGCWDLNTSEFTDSTLTRIKEMHTNVDFMVLANDDKWVITAGNHGDVGVFDRTTSRLVSYTRVSAAFFYVERVWVRGDRVIFITDVGALFDGRLQKQAPARR
jgi:WD40 repeat protein